MDRREKDAQGMAEWYIQGKKPTQRLRDRCSGKMTRKRSKVRVSMERCWKVYL